MCLNTKCFIRWYSSCFLIQLHISSPGSRTIRLAACLISSSDHSCFAAHMLILVPELVSPSLPRPLWQTMCFVKCLVYRSPSRSSPASDVSSSGTRLRTCIGQQWRQYPYFLVLLPHWLHRHQRNSCYVRAPRACFRVFPFSWCFASLIRPDRRPVIMELWPDDGYIFFLYGVVISTSGISS
jgi:hypothetical protein